MHTEPVTLQLALDVFLIALAAWFWPHCARPALVARRATPLAHRLVLGVTVLVIAGYTLSAAAKLVPIDGATVWWTTTIIGALWVLVVGLGYLQGYELLVRATGRVGPRSN